MEPRETLAATAALLFGDQWQRPLARALGPHFPGGARESIDDRLVRRWASGQKPIPKWVFSALDALVAEHGTYLPLRLQLPDRMAADESARASGLTLGEWIVIAIREKLERQASIDVKAKNKRRRA